MSVFKNIIVNTLTLASVSLLFACSESSTNLEPVKELIRPVKVAEVVSTNGNNIKTFPATV